MVGLVLVFPLLVSAVATGTPRISAGSPVLAVEMLLVGGLVFAGRERRRLLVELEAGRTRPAEIGTFAPPILGRARVAARSSLFGYLRR
jgi:hypothetical protein